LQLTKNTKEQFAPCYYQHKTFHVVWHQSNSKPDEKKFRY